MDPNKILQFDQAMALTGFGLYNVWITIVCGTIVLGTVLETIGISFIIPSAQCDLNLTLTHKGWVGAIPFTGLLLSSIFWAYMADTRGRKKVLMVAMTLASVTSALSSLAPNLWSFAFMRLISALMMSAANVCVFPFYGEFTPKEYVDTMMSVLSSIIVFSSAIGALIAWAVFSFEFNQPLAGLGISFRPWRLLVIVYAMPFLVATFCLAWVPESPKFLLIHGGADETLLILKRMYQCNTRKHQDTFPVEDIIIDDMDHLGLRVEGKSAFRTIWNQTSPLFAPPHLKYILIFALLNFGIYASTSSFMIWLPDIANKFREGLSMDGASGRSFCELVNYSIQKQKSNSPNSVIPCDDTFHPNSYPLVLSLICIIGIVNVFMAIALKWTQKKIALVVIIGIGCFAAINIIWIKNPWVSWVFFTVFQCCAIVRGILVAYGVELFPTNYRAMALCLLLIFGRIGIITGSNIIGRIMEAYCPGNFIIFALLLLVCIIMCSVLPGKNSTPIEVHHEIKSKISML